MSPTITRCHWIGALNIFPSKLDHLAFLMCHNPVSIFLTAIARDVEKKKKQFVTESKPNFKSVHFLN